MTKGPRSEWHCRLQRLSLRRRSSSRQPSGHRNRPHVDWCADAWRWGFKLVDRDVVSGAHDEL